MDGSINIHISSKIMYKHHAWGRVALHLEILLVVLFDSPSGNRDYPICEKELPKNLTK